MEGVCAPAARACHADNLPILPVETPRTFGTLTTRYVSRRRCVTASMHCNAHCAAAAAASRRARLGRKQSARGEAIPFKNVSGMQSTQFGCYRLFRSSPVSCNTLAFPFPA